MASVNGLEGGFEPLFCMAFCRASLNGFVVPVAVLAAVPPWFATPGRPKSPWEVFFVEAALFAAGLPVFATVFAGVFLAVFTTFAGGAFFTFTGAGLFLVPL